MDNKKVIILPTHHVVVVITWILSFTHNYMEVDNKLLIYMPYNPPFGGGGHDDKSYFINLDLQLVVDGKSIYFHAQPTM